jgi:uncharacterized protein (DUF58 family)
LNTALSRKASRSERALDATSAQGDASRKGFFRRLRPPRRLKTTREGKYFIAITFGVGFVGILTANNLLYVLLGMLLSLIIVSGLLSDSSLRSVRVSRRLPQRAQVGRPHLVEIEVFNHKKRLPSYAVEIEDLRAGQPADKRCFFLKVSPGSSQVAAYRRTPARRGLDRHVGFRIATRFPFGFFEKSREIKSDGELIIYPAVDPVRLPSNLDGHSTEGYFAQTRGSGDEILGLRAMREGDDPRDIYWKRSSATGTPVVLERAREVQSRVVLKLQNTFVGPEPTEQLTDTFERRIREVASLAVAHLRRGESIRIEASSGASCFASPASGADLALRFLALLELERQGEAGTPHVHLASSGPPGPPSSGQVVAVVPTSRAPVLSDLEAGMEEEG